MITHYTITQHGDLVEPTISKRGYYGNHTEVYPYATIEDHCTIGELCVIGSNVFVGVNSIIGDGTRIQHGAFICRGAKIGKNVFIGPLAILTDDKYPVVGGTFHEGHYKAEPPILEDGCSIGAGAIIMPGVTVGKGAMVGAGAVVTHNVAGGVTVAKVPAVIVKTGHIAEPFEEIPRSKFDIVKVDDALGWEMTDNTFFHD